MVDLNKSVIKFGDLIILYAGKVLLCLGKTVGGLWQDSHAEQMMTPSQMSQFEMGLQFTPSVNKELKKLKCGTNFIRKMFVNVQNPTESILQVLCQNQEWYLWMQGMPPETSRVVAYPFDPILN